MTPLFFILIAVLVIWLIWLTVTIDRKLLRITKGVTITLVEDDEPAPAPAEALAPVTPEPVPVAAAASAEPEIEPGLDPQIVAVLMAAVEAYEGGRHPGGFRVTGIKRVGGADNAWTMASRLPQA